LGNNSLGIRFRADAHLRTGVRDRAPRCTVVRHATRARTRVLRGEDAAPERNPHHQHFRACSFRRRSLSRGHLGQLPLSRCAEPDSKLYLRRFRDRRVLFGIGFVDPIIENDNWMRSYEQIAGRFLLVALTFWALAMVVPDFYRLYQP